MTISSAPSGLVAFIVTPPRLKPGLSSQGPLGRNRLQSPTGSWAMFSRPFGPKPAPKSDRFLGYVFKALRAETGFKVRQVPGLSSQGPLGPKPAPKSDRFLGYVFKALRAETGSKVRQVPELCFQGPSGRNRLQSPTGSWASSQALRAETGSKVRQVPGLCFQGPSGRNRRSRSLSVKRLRRIADSK
jgi:hypothetical protein